MEETLIPAKADKVYSQWPLNMREIGSMVSKEAKTENTEVLLEQLDQLVPEGKASLEWNNEWGKRMSFYVRTEYIRIYVYISLNNIR